MNGGLLHAVEACTPVQLAEVSAGYRYFGVDGAAEVVSDFAARWGDGTLDLDSAEALELEADQRYSAVVADDEVLVLAFEGRFATHPTEFAPVQPDR